MSKATVHRLTPEMSAGEINALLSQLKPGDQVLFAPGIYRQSIEINARGTAKKPITISAEETHSAIITGTDVVTGWQSDGDDWYVDINLSSIAPKPKYGVLAGRREQVFVDGQPLSQVLYRHELRSGSFFYDDKAKRLFIRPQVFTGEIRGGETEMDKGSIQGGGSKTIDRNAPEHSWPFLIRPFQPEQHGIEVTKRNKIFALTGNFQDADAGSAHIIVRGLVFRGSGDAPQQAMVHIGGIHQLIEDCIIEYGAARGFDFRCQKSTMRRCVTRMNGQLGFSGYGTDNLIEDCELSYNNTKHSSFVCFEQGGCKICRTHRFIMRNVRVIGNDGPGLWYDIDNTEALIERCWCEGNTGPGIMYEISSTATIRNNVCWKNGFQTHKDVTWDSYGNSVGAEEPIYGQGILIQMSRDNQVYNNTCVGNRRVGIELRHHPYQQAGNPGHATTRYKCERNTVFNNLLADNGWCNFDESIPPLNPTKSDEVNSNTYDYNLYHSPKALLQHGGDLNAYARWAKH
ncbi:MAG: right-handed parallel beta-helix repeat-containing protein [Verrucomicrobia bacterium]|nr:right-handed parallel beta-helix repeat-containing protein [Verrucomicrobiota bacterium]